MADDLTCTLNTHFLLAQSFLTNNWQNIDFKLSNQSFASYAFPDSINCSFNDGSPVDCQTTFNSLYIIDSGNTTRFYQPDSLNTLFSLNIPSALTCTSFDRIIDCPSSGFDFDYLSLVSSDLITPFFSYDGLTALSFYPIPTKINCSSKLDFHDSASVLIITFCFFSFLIGWLIGLVRQ